MYILCMWHWVKSFWVKSYHRSYFMQNSSPSQCFWLLQSPSLFLKRKASLLFTKQFGPCSHFSLGMFKMLWGNSPTIQKFQIYPWAFIILQGYRNFPWKLFEFESNFCLSCLLLLWKWVSVNQSLWTYIYLLLLLSQSKYTFSLKNKNNIFTPSP